MLAAGDGLPVFVIHDVATGEHIWYRCLRAGPHQNVTRRIEVDLVTEEARGQSRLHENATSIGDLSIRDRRGR